MKIIMDKEELFKKELAELMDKHNVEFEIDVKDGYSGVQSVKLVFHLKDEGNRYTSTDNDLHKFNGLNTEINSEDIRNCDL